MIAFVVAAIFTPRKLNSIIYLSIFSLLASWSYVFDHAPDVAIAEAVIGSTMFTILFLVAMKKYRRYRVFFLFREPSGKDKMVKKLVRILKKFAFINDIQFDKVYVLSHIDDIHERGIEYDFVIQKNLDNFFIFGREENEDFQLFIDYIKEEHPDVNITFKNIDW
jgi:uncharacterized MnhB-related membrane protein